MLKPKIFPMYGTTDLDPTSLHTYFYTPTPIYFRKYNFLTAKMCVIGKILHSFLRFGRVRFRLFDFGINWYMKAYKTK